MEATVVKETLSDGSITYNVVVRYDDKSITIGAIDESGANNIAFSINRNASWMTVQL